MRRSHPGIPLLRYADDLLLLCRSAGDAADAADDLARRVRSAGTPLKGAARDSVVDLGGDQTLRWLGFRLRREGDRVAVRVDDRAWERLAWTFAKAHLVDAAPLRAAQAVRGWVDQLGPCYPFEDRKSVLRRVRDVAAAHAFDEVPGPGELLGRWRAAHARWRRLAERHAPPPPERRDGLVTSAPARDGSG